MEQVLHTDAPQQLRQCAGQCKIVKKALRPLALWDQPELANALSNSPSCNWLKRQVEEPPPISLGPPQKLTSGFESAGGAAKLRRCRGAILITPRAAACKGAYRPGSIIFGDPPNAIVVFICHIDIAR